MTRRVRLAVRVEGVVQGVGFRPFVYGLARRLGLDGQVGNDSDGVFAEVEGTAAATAEFVRLVRDEAPRLAVVDSVRVVEIEAVGDGRVATDGAGTKAAGRATGGFKIVDSPRAGVVRTLVSADSATCPECLAEMADPTDRRYRYPFVNCTNCGPRFTIVTGVPYDRPLTTMAAFPMCADCAAEYHDPADRRFHAQPVCCPACGPALRLDGQGRVSKSPPAAGRAVALLAAGKVLAIKGLGGYHLAADAGNQDAVATLRRRKHREDKPFAVMVADMDSARRLCVVDPAAEEALTGSRRPIVLMPRNDDAPVADAVAPGNRQLGLMLPYTPLHHLLLRDLARPLVLTSANVSDEPIVYRDDELPRLAGIADAFLTHDRAIHTRTDDSVVREFRGRVRVQRRSRGFVPEPVLLARPVPRHVLGCGAELKNTFCLAKDRHAFLSHHIGDLENYETFRSFTEGIDHLRTLFDIDPVVVAHDLHPEYLSTKYALDLPDVELVGVQHHHAHIASCLAENGESGPVLGVAFDGLGYGTDGTIWGGEFLLADLVDFRRVGHLAPVRMPGGTAAIRAPWRMAAAYLDSSPDDLTVVQRNAAQWADVVALGRSGVNSPLTSSAGRLFDAVAALLGVRDSINYEGQAAIELEQHADPNETNGYHAGIDGTTVSGADLVQSCVDDLRAGIDAPVIAARFHNGVAQAITETCLRLRDTTGVGVVALSGGVFQNLLLLHRTVSALERAGLRVLVHSRVPTNDGGISLGQAVIAAARDQNPP